MLRNIQLPARMRRLPGWARGAAAVLPVVAIAWGYAAVHRPAPVAPRPPVVKVAGSRQVHQNVPKAPKPVPTTLPVSQFLAFPRRYDGADVHGTAVVTRMEGERAFWVKANGKKAFVVLSEALGPPPAELAAGKRIKLQGRVWSPARMAELPEITELDDGVLDRVRGQRAILEATHLKWAGL